MLDCCFQRPFSEFLREITGFTHSSEGEGVLMMCYCPPETPVWNFTVLQEQRFSKPAQNASRWKS